MGSVRLPNLSNNGIYSYYKNLINFNFSFWYYYYYYFFLKSLILDIWTNKGTFFLTNSKKKINFKLKNCFIAGDTNLIVTSSFVLIKFSLFNYYNKSYFSFLNLNFNIKILSYKCKQLKKLNYKFEF